MKKYGYIYKITLPDGETYVGKRKWNKRGLDPRYHGSGVKLRKYSIEDRKIVSLELTYSEEDACNKEMKWIAKLQPTLNLTSGGDGGFEWTKYKTPEEICEIKRKISKNTKKAMRKFYDSLTPEERLQKMHRDFTPEQIKKRNNKIKEHNNKPEVKQRISKASKKMWENISEQEKFRRTAGLREYNSHRTKQQCSEASRKGWITRKTNLSRRKDGQFSIF